MAKDATGRGAAKLRLFLRYCAYKTVSKQCLVLFVGNVRAIVSGMCGM